MVQTGAFLYALIGYHTKPCKIMVQDTIFVSFVTSIHKIGVEFAVCEKIDVYNPAVLLQIIQVSLSPYTYGLLFFGW